jgi:hypothetical protein
MGTARRAQYIFTLQVNLTIMAILLKTSDFLAQNSNFRDFSVTIHPI